MLRKLQLHVKLTRRIASNFFNNFHIKIHNNKIIGSGGLAQQVVEVWSNILGALFLKDYPHLFKETNRHAWIDDNPLAKKDKDVV